MMSQRRIAYLGAGGPFGNAMLDELLRLGWHVVILARNPQAIPARPNTTVVRFSLDPEAQPALVDALRGAEVAMCSVSGRARTGVDSFSLQKPLIDAAIAARVRRYIPSEWAADQTHPKSLQLPMYESRRTVTQYLKEKAAKGEIEYTVFYSGALFEWALLNGWLGFDIKARAARILDGGYQPFNVSTWATCARATVRALSPEHFQETANRELRVGDGMISQNEVLRFLEEATGASFTVQNETGEESLQRGLAVLASGMVTPEAVRDCIVATASTSDGAFAWGNGDNEWLGVTKVNLQAIVHQLVGNMA